MSVKIEIHPGDVLASGAPIIAHQVNCKGVMGAGVAKAIKKKYRSVYNDFRKLCVEKGAALMGETQFVWTADRTVVANCFAQNEFGIGSRQTDYDAFRSCMSKLCDFAKKKGVWRIAMPYKIGCGLAGGNWDIVQKIIAEEFEWYTGTVEFWSIDLKPDGPHS